MVSCSFLSPFLPRLGFGLAVGPPLRLLPEAARSPAGLLWEELGLELWAAAAACRADERVPAILRMDEVIDIPGGKRNMLAQCEL